MIKTKYYLTIIVLVYIELAFSSCNKRISFSANAEKKRDSLCVVLEQDIKYLRFICMLDLNNNFNKKSNNNSSFDYSWQIYVSALEIIGFSYQDDNYHRMIDRWIKNDYIRKNKYDVEVLEIPQNGNFNMMKCIDFYHSKDLNNFLDSVRNQYRHYILNGEYDYMWTNFPIKQILNKKKLTTP